MTIEQKLENIDSTLEAIESSLDGIKEELESLNKTMDFLVGNLVNETMQIKTLTTIRDD